MFGSPYAVGGENVAQAMESIEDKTETTSGGGSHIPKDSKKDQKPLSRETRRAIRTSILVPFFISLTLCIVHFAVLLITDLTTLENEAIMAGAKQAVIAENLIAFVDLFIGYFSVSIIATVVVMLLQEYFFRETSWLNEALVLPLMAALFIYIIFFVLYLVPVTGRVFKWLLAASTIPFVLLLWFSLRADIRHIEAAEHVFSGHK